MSLSLCLVPTMLCTHMELDQKEFLQFHCTRKCSLSITSESFIVMARALNCA